jgi:hypothetical protein
MVLAKPNSTLQIQHSESADKKLTIIGDSGKTKETLYLEETPIEIGPPEYSFWERLNPFRKCPTFTKTIPLTTINKFNTIENVSVDGTQENTIVLSNSSGTVLTIEPGEDLP